MTSKTPPAKTLVQGEGDYTAARRHRKSVEAFVRTHDIEHLARNAEPETAEHAGEMEKAEEWGRARAKQSDRPESPDSRVSVPTSLRRR